jgi:trehalose-6-phosphate synthase
MESAASPQGMSVACFQRAMHDITHYLNDCKFILVSNREPYEHIRGADGSIQVKQPAGGLVSALDPTMRRTQDERGVLLLSRFTGSAEEIEGAVLINPFNIDGFVAAIRTALEMPADERRRRMRRMRQQLHNSTIFDWLDSILARSSEIMADQASDHAAV